MEEEQSFTGEVFSPLHVYFYLLNSIMGSGFLGIPFVFQVAGDVLSMIVLAVFAFASYYVASILIEAMSRAEAIQRIRDDDVQEIIPKFSRVMSCATPGFNTTLLSGELRYSPQITPRKFELAEMHHVCLGTRMRWVFLGFFLVSYWGVLLSYTQVFASSMTDIIPLFGFTCDVYKEGGFGTTCRLQYWVWIAIFSGVTITLVLLGLKEQKIFQYIMSCARFATVGLILILCFVRIGQGHIHAPSFAKTAGIGNLSSLVFANQVHPNIPTYVQYMKYKRTYINRILKYLFLTTFVLYTLLGLLMSITFDSVPEALVTLAWKGLGSDYDGAWWAYMLMYIILIFPAIDALSAFPLNAIPLAENIMSTKHPQLTIEELESLPRKEVYTFRLFTIVPPLIISVFTYDLGVAQEFAGLSAYYVVFINIALLHMYTLHRFPRESNYEGWWSPKIFALICFYFFTPLFLANLGLNIATVSGN